MSTLRGCPPPWVCGGGISGAKIAHCASVRSEGYRFRNCPAVAKCVYSFIGEACANCLPNQAFCQGQFPESLLHQITPLQAEGITPHLTRQTPLAVYRFR